MATTPHAALRSASRLIREFPNRTKTHQIDEVYSDLAGSVPKAACRRAVETVLEVRSQETKHLGVSKGTKLITPRTIPSRTARSSSHAGSSLNERLAEYRQESIRQALLDSHFRLGPGGGITVEFGEPNVSISAQKEWRSGQGGFGMVTTDTWVNLTIPERWHERVERPGLNATGGLMVLDAEAVMNDGDITVYRAVWAKQGRGYHLNIDRGYIARHNPSGELYHSTHNDPEVAARSLRRKLAIRAIPQEERDERKRRCQERQIAQMSRLVERLTRWDLTEIAHVEVSLKDSYRAGNCEPGTLAFRDRYFPERCGDATATIGEIAQKVGRLNPSDLSKEQLVEARQLAAACLVAVRRDKAARRALSV